MGNIISYYTGYNSKPSEVIETKYGKIVGRTVPIGDGRSVDAFLGVPFAKPPVGQLRFQKPVPPDAWTDVRQCTSHASRAPQDEMFVEKIFIRHPISEDCLYLNVFAPQWKTPDDQPKGRAVMMFIHGGCFAAHSSVHYGDDGIARLLCSKEVIVVTIQYRLGVLGFSATDDSNVVPNLGLWDQALALNWVKDNIASFSGDPKNITLFGQSAGGASVDMLSLSPYTRDLFSKGICMGGSANCDWAVTKAGKVRTAMISLATSLGWKPPQSEFDEEVNRDLVSFLREQPSKSLGLRMGKKGKNKANRYGMDFVPIIDGDFLPEAIGELRKKTPPRVCMAGVTDYEGLLFAAFGKKQYDRESISRMIENTIKPEAFPDFARLREQATRLYVKKGQCDDEVMHSYIRLFSDLFITNGVHEAGRDMTLAGHTVYLYNFEYCPQSLGLLGWYFPFVAATHCMELPYLFGKGIVHTFRPTATDHRMVEQFTTLFTNFAKHGDPNDDKRIWRPLAKENTWEYLNINQECQMMDSFHERRAEFWNELINKDIINTEQ